MREEDRAARMSLNRSRADQVLLDRGLPLPGLRDGVGAVPDPGPHPSPEASLDESVVVPEGQELRARDVAGVLCPWCPQCCHAAMLPPRRTRRSGTITACGKSVRLH